MAQGLDKVLFWLDRHIVVFVPIYIQGNQDLSGPSVHPNNIAAQHGELKATLALAPAQLLAEDREVVELRVADQQYAIGRALDIEPVPSMHRLAGLPIDGAVEIGNLVVDREAQGLVSGGNDRPLGEGVGTDGRDDHRVDLGVD